MAILNSPKLSNKMLVNFQDNTKRKHHGIQKSTTNLHSKDYFDREANSSPSNQRREEKLHNNQTDEQKMKKFALRSVSGIFLYKFEIWW